MPDRGGRAFPGSVALAAGLTAAFTVVVSTRVLGARGTTVFDDLGQLLAPLLAFAASLGAARIGPRETRRAWAFMAGASGLWAGGQAIWTGYEVVLRRDVPPVSPADAGFLGAVLLMAAALLAFPSAPDRFTSRVRTILDGFIVAGSILSIAWVLVLGPIMRGGPLGAFAKTVDLAYPIGDVVILVLAMLAIARANPARRASLGMLVAGLCAMALADAAFVPLAASDSYETGSLLDAVWFASFLLVGLAALLAIVVPAGVIPVRRRRFARGLLPSFSVLILLLAGGISASRNGAVEPPVVWIGVAVLLFVVIRQMIALEENIELHEEVTRKYGQIVEAQRAQDRFVDAVAHELGGPVTALVGATKTLLRPELGLGSNARMLAETSEHAAAVLSGLLEDLLVAGTVAEELALARSPFDVATETRAAVDEARGGPLRIVTVTPETALGLGDAPYVRTIIDHLLANAAKFAPAGTTVTVRIERSPASVDVVVQDEGPGIAPEHREHVFERFAQLPSADGARPEGAGLGLFIARRLAGAMGARLTIDDVSGGASVRLSLPPAAGPASAGRGAEVA